MATLLAVLTGLCLLATVATLFAGMLGLVRGSNSPERSNALMRWRVMLQGATIVLFILLLLVLKTG